MKPVLYVSHSKRGSFYYNDASARYRCVFPAEELISKGEQAHAIHFSQINQITLSDYQKIIFHRPKISLKLWYIVRKAQTKGIELWVDFDDLLFCPELSDSSAAVQSGKMPASLAKKHAARYLKALQLFTNCQVSTIELANQLNLRLNLASGPSNKKKYNVKVTYNKVPERWVKQTEIIPAKERLEKKIIRYLPGTSHHKHDFAHVELFLAELLHKNPDYHLNIIGDLEFDNTVFPNNQISQTPFQPYEQLPSLINDSWIIIAPLVDNVFNRCKSGLKFWESGIFGIPVISSPLKDIERFANKGLCISDDTNEWKSFITLMAESESYMLASEQAEKYSQQAFFTQEQQDHRYIYLKLTSEFGPRWPAIELNPTTKGYAAFELTYKLMCKSEGQYASNSASTKAKKIKALEVEAVVKMKADTPPASNKFLRKAKKLYRSPLNFIKDSKLFYK